MKLAGNAGEQVRCPEALPGDALVRTVSRRQMAQARQSWEGEHRAMPVSAEMILRVGHPLQLRLTCGEISVLRQGDPVQVARGKPLDEGRVKAQLQKTGGTPFEMREIRLDADANAFCAVSELNELRREALGELEKRRSHAPRKPGKPGPCPILPGKIQRTLLRAQSGDVSALKLALENGADQAIFAPRDLRKLDDALQLERFFLMPPQVIRQEELERLHQWAEAHQERIFGTYITNIGQLNFSWPGTRLAGFSMNIANNRALAELNPAEYAPSVELTARQIGQLGGAKELVVYGRLPLMQLRHCPRRAAENLPGKHRDCRLCDVSGKGDLPCLIDRTGAAFPLLRMAYASGCVLQLLNSVPLMLLRHVESPRGGLAHAGGKRRRGRSRPAPSPGPGRPGFSKRPRLGPVGRHGYHHRTLFPGSGINAGTKSAGFGIRQNSRHAGRPCGDRPGPGGLPFAGALRGF